MKFLVDAQLPQRLARWLQAEGHEAIHTRDLPEGNRTGDATINELSLHEQRVVITKDENFVDTFLLRHQPYKLLLVATGNIRTIHGPDPGSFGHVTPRLTSS